jgi:hypothetical protein
MENSPAPSFTVTVQLAEAVPEEGRSELQHKVDNVFSELGFTRIEFGDLMNTAIITYQGAGNFDRPKLESEILGRLSEQGVSTKGERRKVAIIAFTELPVLRAQMEKRAE